MSSQYNTSIIIYFLNDDEFKGLHNTNDISVMAYCRFIVPYILQDINISKVLYLDVDMLCVSDLKSLLEKEFEHKIAYVTRDFTSNSKFWRQYCNEIGMINNNYFNSGMMLINVLLYTREDIGQKALALAKEKDYKYMDQDVLNILLENKVIFDNRCYYNSTMSVQNDNFEESKTNTFYRC